MSSTRPVRLVARVVWLEALRRKDLWVLAILMGLYVAGAVALEVVRGDSPGEAQFVFNLGLTTSYWLVAALTALFASRALPAEFDNRTLYPLLAKPVRRSDVILGKFLPVAATGVGALWLFTGFVVVVSRWLPEFRVALLVQCVVLQSLALAALAALTLCATLWLPAPVALIVGLGLFWGGGVIASTVRANVGAAYKGVANWLLFYMPNFSALDLGARFTDGGPPLGAAEFVALAAYAVVMAAAFLFAAMEGFRRKAL